MLQEKKPHIRTMIVPSYWSSLQAFTPMLYVQFLGSFFLQNVYGNVKAGYISSIAADIEFSAIKRAPSTIELHL